MRAGTRFNWGYAVFCGVTCRARFLYEADAQAFAALLQAQYPAQLVSVAPR
jgi:hypothetical protein